MHSQICTERVSIYDSYDSSYDYTVYDIGFVFIDEEEEEELFDEEFYYAQVVSIGMGDNIH